MNRLTPFLRRSTHAPVLASSVSRLSVYVPAKLALIDPEPRRLRVTQVEIDTVLLEPPAVVAPHIVDGTWIVRCEEVGERVEVIRAGAARERDRLRKRRVQDVERLVRGVCVEGRPTVEAADVHADHIREIDVVVGGAQEQAWQRFGLHVQTDRPRIRLFRLQGGAAAGYEQHRPQHSPRRASGRNVERDRNERDTLVDGAGGVGQGRRMEGRAVVAAQGDPVDGPIVEAHFRVRRSPDVAVVVISGGGGEVQSLNSW